MSLVLEIVGHSLGGYDIESTNELLMKVEILNEKLADVYEDTGTMKSVTDLEEKKDVNTEAQHNKSVVVGNNALPKKSKNKKSCTGFDVDMKEMHIKNLRQMKVRGTKVQNIKSKLCALRLQDEISGKKEVIKLPGDDREKVGDRKDNTKKQNHRCRPSH